MKKFILFLLLLASINCHSQTNEKITPTTYLDNVIWNQIFSDFEIQVPVLFFTPYVYVFGSFSYIDNEVFIKNSLAPDNIFSVTDLIRKEFVRNLNASFFNYLPKDSVMLVNALYKNRLLCSFILQKSDSVLSLEYKLPNQVVAERVIFNWNGNILKRIRNKQSGTITTSVLADNDTLRTVSTDKDFDSNFTLQETKIKNGLVYNDLLFKVNKLSNKKKIVQNQVYKYDNRKLITIANLTARGFVMDSLVYYYKSDTLIGISHNQIKENPNKVIYTYHEGKLSQKNILTDDISLKVDYEYFKGQISKMFFFTKGEINSNIYEFEYAMDGNLFSVIHKTSTDLYHKDDFKKQYAFTYNSISNLESIRVIDKKGIIEKEIKFEYTYK